VVEDLLDDVGLGDGCDGAEAAAAARGWASQGVDIVHAFE
jgi:hypothetical protein